MRFLDLLIGYLMDAARWAIVLVLSLMYPELYSPWTGKVVEIVRPDEIRVERTEKKTENVRLYGIDSPLEPQRFAREARLYVTYRVLNRMVVVQPLPGKVEGPWYGPNIESYDRYHRVIGLVTIDGKSLDKELLEKGIARWYQPFVPFERGFKRLGDRAREQRVGLWQYDDAVAPWSVQGTYIAKVHPFVTGASVGEPQPSEPPPQVKAPEKVPAAGEIEQQARPVETDLHPPAIPPAEQQTPAAPPDSPSLQGDLPPADAYREKEYFARLKRAYQAVANLNSIYWYACSQIGLNWEKRGTIVGLYNPDAKKETQAEELVRAIANPCPGSVALHDDVQKLWSLCLHLKSLANHVPDDEAQYAEQLRSLHEESKRLLLRLAARLGPSR